MPIATELDPLFEAAGERHNIDPNWLRAVALQESGGDPNIAPGAAGEIGLMQFIPETARRFGINPADPAQAVDAAGQYLRQNLDRGRALAAAGENIGDPAVYATRLYNGSANNPATAEYAAKVAGHYNQLTQRGRLTQSAAAPDQEAADTGADTRGAGEETRVAGGDSLLQDYFSGKLGPPLEPSRGAAGVAPARSAAAPLAAPAAAPSGGASAAAPVLGVQELVDTYNNATMGPRGRAVAAQALAALQKMAPEGYELLSNGTIRLRPGYAGGAAQLEGARTAGQKAAELATAAPIAEATAAGHGRGAAPFEPRAIIINGQKYEGVPGDLAAALTRLQIGRLLGGAEAPAAGEGGAAVPPPGAAPGGAAAPIPAAAGSADAGVTIGGTPVEPLGYGEAAKRLSEYSTAASAAQEDLATLQSMRDLLSGGMKTGFGADTRAQIGRYLAALNVDPKSIEGLLGINPADADAFQKQALRLSTQAVRLMGAREPGGVISMFTRIYPSLETQPGALDLMTNVLSLQAQRVQDRRDFILDKSQGGRAGMPAVHQAEAQFDRANPAVDYLHAGEAMSPSFYTKGWKDAETPERQRAILNLIPQGRVYFDPGGTRRKRGDTLTIAPEQR
jgi:hypothetical protein